MFVIRTFKYTLIAIVIIISSSAWSATYYVKTGGNDASAGTSDGAAWATTARVMATTGYDNIVTSGDTVYFRSQDTWTSTGNQLVLTATAGVTYDGKTYGSGTRATFIPGGPSSDPPIYGIVMIPVSNVIFRGFEIDGNDVYTGGLYIGNTAGADISGIEIDDCVIHNVGDPNEFSWGYSILVSVDTAEKTVSNVTIKNTEVYESPANEGISVYAKWGVYNSRNNNILIRNCYIHDMGTDGIEVSNHSDNVTIEYCTLANNGTHGIMTRVSPSGEGPGNVIEAPNNLIIRYNTIYDNLENGVAFTNPRDFVQTADIYGNLIYNNGTNGGSGSAYIDLYITSSTGFTWSGSTFNIYNNTFYSTRAPSGGYRGIVAFGWDEGSLSGCTVNFKNNIIYSGAANTWNVNDTKGATVNHSNNLYYNAGGATAIHYRSASTNYDRNGGATDITNWEATAQKTDPAFSGGTLPTRFTGKSGACTYSSGWSCAFDSAMAPDTDYFQLTVDSPAKDTGATLASYTGCINGAGLAVPTTRPLGAAFDIGAYEYGTVAQSGGSAGSGFKLSGTSINSQGTASCSYTSMDALTGTGYHSATLGYSTSIYGRGFSWTEANAASGYTAKRFIVSLKKTGSPTFNITGYICTSQGATPVPDSCTAADSTISAGDLTTSYTDYTFNLSSGVVISDSTRYWIALIPDGVGGENDYVAWNSSDDGAENRSGMTNSNTWTNNSTSVAGNFSVWQCE